MQRTDLARGRYLMCLVVGLADKSLFQFHTRGARTYYCVNERERFLDLGCNFCY